MPHPVVLLTEAALALAIETPGLPIINPGYASLDLEFRCCYY